MRRFDPPRVIGFSQVRDQYTIIAAGCTLSTKLSKCLWASSARTMRPDGQRQLRVVAAEEIEPRLEFAIGCLFATGVDCEMAHQSGQLSQLAHPCGLSVGFGGLGIDM
jgi:hypothetical protein